MKTQHWARWLMKEALSLLGGILVFGAAILTIALGLPIVAAVVWGR